MSKNTHFSSFDIFDTCLVRACGTPENFFDILSKRVFSGQVTENERQGFIIARREVEFKLYHSNPKANIFDIYDSLSYNHPLILPNKDILEIELALEKEMLMPVFKIKGQINSLRQKGGKILFISDMYLPVLFLTDILKEYGLYKSGDKVYVSSDVGKNKFGGEIYKYIHEIEKIPYNRWTHYGDNKKADIIIPKKLGIKTIHINHKYSTYEQNWIDNGNITLFKYSQIMAGISRALNHSLPENPRKLLLLDVIAPLYLSFIGYIFDDAQKRGITHLFFCARDTYQLFQVAKVFNKQYPNIKIHYLRVSRKSLTESEPQVLIDYFKQEGLASNDNNAIIDTTSTGGSFSTINNILTKFGYHQCFAYFLVKWFEPTNNECLYDSAIRQKYVYSKRTNSIFKNLKIITLLENIFSSNTEKRTIGYKEENSIIIPAVFDNIDNEDSVQTKLFEMQEYHTDILKKISEIYISSGLVSYSHAILHQLAIPSFSKLAYYPTKEYTESLCGCSQKENNILLPYVKKESFVRLFLTRGHDTCWSRATIFYNMPIWTHKFLLKYIDYKESL